VWVVCALPTEGAGVGWVELSCCAGGASVGGGLILRWYGGSGPSCWPVVPYRATFRQRRWPSRSSRVPADEGHHRPGEADRAVSVLATRTVPAMSGWTPGRVGGAWI
jgi:hypothetical protein